MNPGLVWIVVAVAVAAIIGLIAATGVSKSNGSSKNSMTNDEVISLGIVFTGAGAALVAVIGPQMLGLMAMGVIFLAYGAVRKRKNLGG